MPALSKGWYGSGFFGLFDFGAVGCFGVFMEWELRIFGSSVIVFGEDVGNAVIYCEATGAVVVIPFEADSGKAGAGPVLCDILVFLENAA